MSIFSSESTEIEISIPLNSKADKDGTENALSARPWYCRLF